MPCVPTRVTAPRDCLRDCLHHPNRPGLRPGMASPARGCRRAGDCGKTCSSLQPLSETCHRYSLSGCCAAPACYLSSWSQHSFLRPHAVPPRAVCGGSDSLPPRPGFSQGNQQMLTEGLTPTGASSVESLSGESQHPSMPLSLR